MSPSDQTIVSQAFAGAFQSLYIFNGALAILCFLCAGFVDENELSKGLKSDKPALQLPTNEESEA
jgi:hypothetical protein